MGKIASGKTNQDRHVTFPTLRSTLHRNFDVKMVWATGSAWQKCHSGSVCSSAISISLRVHLSATWQRRDWNLNHFLLHECYDLLGLQSSLMVGSSIGTSLGI